MCETLCCIICGALHHSTQWHDAAVAKELAERDAHTLKLAQTFHWYDETQNGRKRVEYRKISPHWKKHLWDKRDDLTHVRFQRGFHPPIQQQTFAIAQIDIGILPFRTWLLKTFLLRCRLLRHIQNSNASGLTNLENKEKRPNQATPVSITKRALFPLKNHVIYNE